MFLFYLPGLVQQVRCVPARLQSDVNRLRRRSGGGGSGGGPSQEPKADKDAPHFQNVVPSVSLRMNKRKAGLQCATPHSTTILYPPPAAVFRIYIYFYKYYSRYTRIESSMVTRQIGQGFFLRVWAQDSQLTMWPHLSMMNKKREIVSFIILKIGGTYKRQRARSLQGRSHTRRHRGCWIWLASPLYSFFGREIFGICMAVFVRRGTMYERKKKNILRFGRCRFHGWGIVRVVPYTSQCVCEIRPDVVDLVVGEEKLDNLEDKLVPDTIAASHVDVDIGPVGHGLQFVVTRPLLVIAPDMLDQGVQHAGKTRRLTKRAHERTVAKGLLLLCLGSLVIAVVQVVDLVCQDQQRPEREVLNVTSATAESL